MNTPMRELVLLRHAEAESDSHHGDRERPLSAAGGQHAVAAGQWLLAHDCRPDLIVHSPAIRARATAEAVHAQMPQVRLQADEGIYEASPGELLEVLDKHGTDGLSRVLLVGHNPGLERLLGLLTQGRSGNHRGMLPASIARIGFDGQIEPGRGRLLAYWAP